MNRKQWLLLIGGIGAAMAVWLLYPVSVFIASSDGPSLGPDVFLPLPGSPAYAHPTFAILTSYLTRSLSLEKALLLLAISGATLGLVIGFKKHKSV